MKNKILNEFQTSGLSIKDLSRLEEYVTFCLEHNKQLKSNSSSHHILPSSKILPFRKFSNLAEYKWNKAELTYYDHYFAHYLLTLAIDHISVYTAFCLMHNKDVVLKRIKEADLIQSDEYEKIYQKRNLLISQHRKELVEYNGMIISRASAYSKAIDYSLLHEFLSDKMKGNKNIIHLPGVLSKMRKTKSRILENGSSLDQISSLRASLTMKRKINGISIYDNSAKKISNTLTIIEIDGTSIAQKRGKLLSKLLQSRGKWYTLKHAFKPKFEKVISAVELRKISAILELKTKENYLGRSKFGKTTLTQNNKQYLIGLFVEKLEEVPQQNNLHLDHIQVLQMLQTA